MNSHNQPLLASDQTELTRVQQSHDRQQCLPDTSVESLFRKYFDNGSNERTKATTVQQLLEASCDSEANGQHYLQIAEDCFQSGQTHHAMAFAIKSILSRPKGPRAANLIRKLIKETSNQNQAQDCTTTPGTWRIPQTLLEEYLPDYAIQWSGSSTGQGKSFQQINAFAADQIPLTPPKSLQSHHAQAYQFTRTRTIAAKTTIVPDGRLWFDGFNTVVWDCNGRILEPLCTGYPEIIAYKTRNLKPLVKRGKIAQIGNRGAPNYYHWMYDIVPKFAVLEASGFDVSAINQFFVSGLKSQFQHQSLSVLGVERARLHRPSEGCLVTADEILIPTYGSNEHQSRTPDQLRHGIHLHQGAWSSQFLSRKFVHNVPVNPTRRLYITRREAGTRKISNEQEIINLLERYDFETIDLGEYTVTEQANLFARASVVVGVHGAGLTNITHCQPETKILELYGDYTNACFWIISELMGLEHYVHQFDNNDSITDGSSDQQFLTKTERARRASLYINVEELKQLLEFAEIPLNTSSATD